jgi:hypothetical protein
MHALLHVQFKIHPFNQWIPAAVSIDKNYINFAVGRAGPIGCIVNDVKITALSGRDALITPAYIHTIAGADDLYEQCICALVKKGILDAQYFSLFDLPEVDFFQVKIQNRISRIVPG